MLHRLPLQAFVLELDRTSALLSHHPAQHSNLVVHLLHATPYRTSHCILPEERKGTLEQLAFSVLHHSHRKPKLYVAHGSAAA